PEVDASFTFDLSTSGGCATPYISASTEPDWNVFGSGSRMCWGSTQCHLTVTVDSGGSLSSSELGSGYFDCYACVTLAAFPYNGWSFANWSGDLNSTEPIATLCMSGRDRWVTAHFIQDSYPPPVQHGEQICPLILDLDGDGFETSG